MSFLRSGGMRDDEIGITSSSTAMTPVNESYSLCTRRQAHFHAWPMGSRLSSIFSPIGIPVEMTITHNCEPPLRWREHRQVRLPFAPPLYKLSGHEYSLRSRTIKGAGSELLFPRLIVIVHMTSAPILLRHRRRRGWKLT